jgi:heme-degrading monooxygenase HmoA
VTAVIREASMIARVWKGVTLEAKAEAYLKYLQDTGVKEYQATPGNQGVYVLRRIGNGQAEFVLISLWESYEVIVKFAGDEIERAVYYPEDKEYLLSLEPTVTHYEVLMSPQKNWEI